MSEWLGDPVSFTMMRREFIITDIKKDIIEIADFLCSTVPEIQMKWLEVNNSTVIRTKFYFERYHQRHCTIIYPIAQQYKDANLKLSELELERRNKYTRWDELNRKDDLSYKNWGNDVVINDRTKPEEKEYRQLTKSIDSLNYQIRGLKQKIKELHTALTEEILK